MDEHDCLKRSSTAIGSSTSWASSLAGLPGMDGGANGLLSSDPATNPDFYDWTKVHVNYCDGASYSGDRTEPYNVSGEMLFFRGRRILDATIASLLDHGLSSGTHMILKGCSAGGLGTYLHADYVKLHLPDEVDLVALGDAGMFLDLSKWTGDPGYQTHYRYIADMQNVSGLNDRCLEQYAATTPWKCFMAPYTLPYIKTPVFIVQALYDSWQSQNIIGLDCVAQGCTNATEYEAWLNLGEQMKSVLALAPPGSGVFATPCHIHGQVNLNRYWDNLMVNGTSMQDAFSQWWRSRSDLNLLDQGPFGSNRCR